MQGCMHGAAHGNALVALAYLKDEVLGSDAKVHSRGGYHALLLVQECQQCW